MTDKVKKQEEPVKEDVNVEEKNEVKASEDVKVEEEKVVEEASFAKATAAEEECNCEELTQQVEEYKAKYLRAIADYQNYERRVQDQRIEWTKMANKNVILKLLSFLDDLERAEEFVKDTNLAHVKNSFDKMLTSEGLEELAVLNKPYDPYTAEVIDMKEGEEENIVLAVIRKGYTYNGQLLRIAQVTVSKKA